MSKVKLRIDGQQDRRQIVSILADNGYDVTIKCDKDIVFGDEYFVIINPKQQ